MKKNFRVIQINGFRGLILAFFTVSCLIAGFAAFPAFLAMSAWNYLSIKVSSVPIINFGEGVLLWAIIAFSVFIFNKKKFIVSFNAQQELSEDEIKDVVAKFKSQIIESNALKDFQLPTMNSQKEDSEELKNDQVEVHAEVQSENKEN